MYKSWFCGARFIQKALIRSDVDGCERLKSSKWVRNAYRGLSAESNRGLRSSHARLIRALCFSRVAAFSSRLLPFKSRFVKRGVSVKRYETVTPSPRNWVGQLNSFSVMFRCNNNCWLEANLGKNNWRNEATHQNHWEEVGVDGGRTKQKPENPCSELEACLGKDCGFD